jgi:hypothetical protein
MKDGQIKNVCQNTVAYADLSIIIIKLNVLHISIQNVTCYIEQNVPSSFNL